MDIRQLEYFITVAECLSFTEAAKKLYIAQSALSQQIVEMEKKLGVTLFHRSKRSVKLTSAGTVFLNDAIDIVNRYNQAIENVRHTEQGLVGTIRVGVLTDAFSRLLPAVLQKFTGSYPNIKLNLTGFNNGPLMEMLAEDDIDAALTINKGMHYIPEVDWFKIAQDHVSVILPKNHPLAAADMTDLSVLSAENFILLHRHDSPQGYDETIQICANSGFSPKIANQVHSTRDVLLMVESGLGIAILPSHIAENYSQNLCCIPIENGKYTVDLIAAWKKTNSNPSLSYFLDTLKSELKI